MKLRFFSIFALAGLLLSSCAVEEVPVTEHTILAVMEGDQTRTTVTDAGTFTWSEGDQVWLQTTKGSVVGNLSSGEGTSSAEFTYGAVVGEMTGKAVYPYNVGHSISGEVLNFVLPASYDSGLCPLPYGHLHSCRIPGSFFQKHGHRKCFPGASHLILSEGNRSAS